MTRAFADPTPARSTVDAGKMLVRSVITTDRAGPRRRCGRARRACGTPRSSCSTRWCCGRTTARSAADRHLRWLDVQPHRVVAETRFAQGVPFAEDVFRLYEQGVLRGWSIGFVPRQARARRTAAGGGLRVDEWDLLEYSAVPIPENPGALTVAHAEGAWCTTRPCATG